MEYASLLLKRKTNLATPSLHQNQADFFIFSFMGKKSIHYTSIHSYVVVVQGGGACVRLAGGLRVI